MISSSTWEKKDRGSSLCIMGTIHLLKFINMTNQVYYKVRILFTNRAGFLIKLGIKPCLHILEISIFSLNHVIVRPTKIMNNLLKVCKICTFKVIFWHQKTTESFWFFCKEYIWLKAQQVQMSLIMSQLQLFRVFTKNGAIVTSLRTDVRSSAFRRSSCSATTLEHPIDHALQANSLSLIRSL